MANLFNNYPALDDPEPGEEIEEIQETREEKSKDKVKIKQNYLCLNLNSTFLSLVYRNWMNSLGVSPYVNYLYGDLYDGNIMFQIYEFIQPGIVNWKRVTK